MKIFNKQHRINNLIRANKDCNFLYKHTAANIIDRISDFQRKFDNVVDYCSMGNSFDSLANIKTVQDQRLANDNKQIVLEDEEIIPFEKHSIDLFISNLNLHFINDIPGFLLQAKNILAPKGVFMASMFGGKTLWELKDVILKYEINHKSRVVQHVVPMIDIRDLAALMQRAGFRSPIVDSYIIEVEYKSIIKLMKDLNSMGQSNCLQNRNNYALSKTDIFEIDKIYNKMYSAVTFEILTATGFN